MWSKPCRRLYSFSFIEPFKRITSSDLRQGDMSPSEYLGKAQGLIENLALVGRPVSLDEQNLYIFHGLRPKYRALISSLTTKGKLVLISEIADLLNTHHFIYADDMLPGEVPSSASPAGLMVQKTGHRSGVYHGHGRSQHGRGRGQCHRGNEPQCHIYGMFGHTVVHWSTSEYGFVFGLFD